MWRVKCKYEMFYKKNQPQSQQQECLISPMEWKKSVHSIFGFKKYIDIKYVAKVWSQIYEMSDKYTYVLKILIKKYH